MGRIFLNTPQEGQPLAKKGMAKGLRLLEEIWERLEIVGGHIEWKKQGKNGLLPRFIIDGLTTEFSDTANPKTFALEQDGAGTITLTRCHYQRGSNFIETAYTPTVSIATGKLFAIVNTSTGEITAQIDFENDPAQPELVGFALYKITASGDLQTATIDYETGVRVLLAYE